MDLVVCWKNALLERYTFLAGGHHPSTLSMPYDVIILNQNGFEVQAKTNDDGKCQQYCAYYWGLSLYSHYSV